MDYQQFFGFNEPPFRITPDPAYFFPSNAHREALQTLLYSIRSGEGFVQITGNPGTGKTLLIRTILKELGKDFNVAFVFNPRLSPHELLRTLLEDLGLDVTLMDNLPREALLRHFRDFLLGRAAAGQRVLVIIDEAQNLPLDTLEELRLLSNLETEKEKLLQIILVGQRELEQKLEQPEVRQLHQRITIRYCLQHLEKGELAGYIYHRLGVAADHEREPRVQFSASALRAIYNASQGICRLINILCERSLMAAYVEGRKRIYRKDVRKALQSVRGNEAPLSGRRYLVPALFLLLMMVGLGLTGIWYYAPFQPAADPAPQISAGTGNGLRFPVNPSPAPAAPPKIALSNSESDSESPPASPAPPDPEVRQDSPQLPVTPAVPHHPPPAPLADHSRQTPPDAGAKPSSAEAPALHLPAEVLAIAPQAYLVQVLVDTRQVHIWRGTSTAPERVATLIQDWPFGTGLFLAGHDPQQGNFLFNHVAVLRGRPNLEAFPFFRELQTWIRTSAVPLLAIRSDHLSLSADIQRAIPVQTAFQKFITRWENRQLDELFELYGDLITFYQMDQPHLQLQTARQAYQRRQNIFQRSGPLQIGVRQPVFLLDPNTPASAMVVYYQQYRSRIWSDDGTKVLYFNLQDSPAGQRWEVVAELWVQG